MAGVKGVRGGKGHKAFEDGERKESTGIYIKNVNFNSATEPLMNCVTLEKSLYLSFLFCRISLD